VLSDTDPTAHAEMNAIRKATKVLENYHLDGCTLYTSSEPCPMCLGAIYWAHLKRVVFITDRKDVNDVSGFDDKIIYEEISKDFSDRKIIFDKNEELINEGKALLKSWDIGNHKQY
jgi:guanine deaminase